MAQESLGVRINQAAEILGISRSQLRSYTNDGLIQPIEGNAGSVQRGIRYSSDSIVQFSQNHPELLGESKTPEDVLNAFSYLGSADDDQDVSSEDLVTDEVMYLPNRYARQALKEEYGLTDEQIDSHPDFVRADHEMTVSEARIYIDNNPPNALGIANSEQDDEDIEDTSDGSELSDSSSGLEEIDVSEPVVEDIPNVESRINDSTPTASATGEGVTHFIFGLGATGVQIVDQARRSDYYARENGLPTLDTPYRFFVIDTSVDVDPQRPEPGRSHTREGHNKWFENSDIIVLSNLTGGAGRVPVVSEFIANHAL